MHSKTPNKNFVCSCFISVFNCSIFIIAALLIYFLLPNEKVEPKEIAEVTEENSDDTFEIEFSEVFKDYALETSIENYENVDSGLTLYRQSVSRTAVEWFYTHITGDREIAQAILSEADKNDIPLSLAFSLAYTESKYNTKAVHNNSNSTIDRGLFQLNSNTFPELTEADFFNPSTSSKYGIAHLKFCLNTAGNEVSALAMYNAGTSRVRSNKTPQTTLNYVGSIMTYRKMLDGLFEQEVATYFESQIIPGITVAYAASEKHY